MIRTFAAVLAMTATSTAFANDGEFETYLETFPNSVDEGNSFDELTLQGWFVSQGGDNQVGVTQDGQIFDRTTPPPGSDMPSENSNPVGADTATDGRMTFTQVAIANVYFYTQEITFHTTQFVKIAFDTRFAGTPQSGGQLQNDNVRVALRIDDGNTKDWYISDQFVLHTAGSSTWQSHEFYAADLTWELYNAYENDNLENLPRQANPEQTGLPLPDGDVIAWGIYNTKNQQGANRVDDMQLVLIPGDDCNGNDELDFFETTPDDVLNASPQDDCPSAEPVDVGIEYNGNTRGATNQGFVICPTGSAYGFYDQYVCYTPTYDGYLNITTTDSTPETFIISVHDSCPPSADNLVACSGFWPYVTFFVEARQKYYIRIAAAGLGRGAYKVQLNGPLALLNPNDANRNCVPDDCDCLADVTGNWFVGPQDLYQVMNAQGLCTPGEICTEDVNLDGVVDQLDVYEVFYDFGPCPADFILP